MNLLAVLSFFKMKSNLVKTPFNISNQYYSYQTLGLDELNLIEGKYYLLLQKKILLSGV